MYKKVSGSLNFKENEAQTLKFWQENKIFEKSIETRREGKTFTFYDGPPTANGRPHIGHVLTRAIKDLIPRYRTMKGDYVIRKAGWDTHGLPVELEVERMLGLDGKEQIEQYGMAPFIEKCKESVWTYKGMWEQFSGAVGFWADMDDPYVTYHNDFIESEWWALKQIWDKGLLYKGHKIVPYCPRCGTPLSSHEVAQGYKDVKERSAVVKFPVVGEEGVFFLAWTTTPWTLPSNVALCVNADEDYVRLLCEGETYILAEARVEANFGGKETEILSRFKGAELEGMAYRPLFDFCKGEAGKRAFYIVSDGYVTLTDGTGIVHIAPAFGEDDSRVGKKYDLPFVQYVNARGELTEETPWAGVFCKTADKSVLEALRESGLLFAAPLYEHSYPHCWRCNTPIIYYARDSWFIAMTKAREELIANNKTVNWMPESIGTGRFGDWLENVQDWGISRDRYWGTPLNIWECSCGHRHSIGSIAELKSMSKNCPEDIELHRPYIDEVTITCPECGGEMHRVKEVIDCWFDSGAMPFAQWHYPFENKEIFDANFPADFISEGVDQTRGWFYSLIAISTLIFGRSPYKNVIVLGHVQDENGQKMSKSKGNAVDPMDALAEFGADAIRWYFYSNSALWLPNRFHRGAVLEGQRKFMGTLWNTYAFFTLYADIDEFDPTKYTLRPSSELSAMDRWMLSRLNTLVRDCDENMENYKITETTRLLSDFVDEMSNWYVRRSRERFWVPGMPQDKIDAYMTLYTTLVTLAKLAAPFVPFMTEEIYRNLVCTCDKAAPISVHLCLYPECDSARIDGELENAMDEVLKVVTIGRACRNAANIKNRQPLPAIYVSAEEALGESYMAIIRDELNVKAVEFRDSLREFTSYTFKPQLKTLGPKYGKYLGAIRSALSTLDGNAAMDTLESEGVLRLPLGEITAELTRDDLLIDMASRPGYLPINDGGITVVLDTNLTEELICEGFIREVVSKIQTMRKESGFEVMDHIRISFNGSDKLNAVIANAKGEIMGETLGDAFEINGALAVTEGDAVAGKTSGVRSWDINGEPALICVEKI